MTDTGAGWGRVRGWSDLAKIKKDSWTWTTLWRLQRGVRYKGVKL